MERIILIVEDDDRAYEKMEQALQKEAVARNINITTIRAISYTGAKRAIREGNFHAVSFDMQIPKYDNENRNLMPDGGAELINWASERHIFPYILYSSNTVEESREILQKVGVKMEGLICRKEHSCGHSKWAEMLLDIAI